MTKRAILYARVSGDDRKYATSGIESQLADCRNYAGERGYQVVNEFYETPDKATSGADWLPELDRVMKLAQDGGFEVLVVREIDRLARNRFKQMSVEIQLESCGARVEYVIGQFEESAEGRLLKGLMSEFAEYEREKIRERTRRGRLRSVKAGNVTISSQHAVYGYDLVSVDGRRALVINEQEAAVVRLIFDLYLTQGQSIMGIVNYLTERQISKPWGGENRNGHKASSIWSRGTILKILENETYAGRWHYGKGRRVKSAQGQVKAIDRPREEWIEVKVPPIIDEATYQAAQRQRETNKRLLGKQHRRFYLLGGMVRCSHCGNSATGSTRKYRDRQASYYECTVHRAPKRFDYTCDNAHYYRVDAADKVVWEWVRGILMSPDVLQEALDSYQARQTNEQSPIMQMIESTAARLADTEQAKARLLKAYTSGVLSLEDIATEKVELDKRAADLTRALSELRAELNPATITQETIDGIYRDAADLRDGVLLADNDPEAQRRILERLRFEGRLAYADGHHWIDVECLIGAERLSTEFNTIRCYDNRSTPVGPVRASAGCPSLARPPATRRQIGWFTFGTHPGLFDGENHRVFITIDLAQQRVIGRRV